MLSDQIKNWDAQQKLYYVLGILTRIENGEQVDEYWVKNASEVLAYVLRENADILKGA